MGSKRKKKKKREIDRHELLTFRKLPKILNQSSSNPQKENEVERIYYFVRNTNA